MRPELKFEKIEYRKLNSRQQENYNFQKISGILADYGFATIRLRDDWNGADFIAQHADGKTLLRIQLKGRLHIDRKYEGKDLWLCFPSNGSWYLGLHDTVMDCLLKSTGIQRTKSWRMRGSYSYSSLSKPVAGIMEQFLLK